jgi:tyrosyl-tRNA synthetase
MKISTDKNLIEKFLTRGVEGIYPTRAELEKKLLSGDRLRVYQGFDPTGPYLHVGHAMGIRAMKILRDLGHEVIFLVGDYTAKIGDPDKDKTRDALSDEVIEKNMASWKEQAAQLIDFSGSNPVQFKKNYEWLSELKLDEVIKLMSHITTQQMLERDLFDRRIKEGNPIVLKEFIYPLLHGYDSVAMKVDLEVGGADQIFNMLVGRDLCRSYLGKEKFIRANKMMDAPDGRTMSKTKGNGINLGDTAEDMYGKAMSYPDSAILSGLELLTEMPENEIIQIKKEMEQGANPMQFKKLMAFEVVKIIKGEVAARAGEEFFAKKVQNKEIPNDIKIEKINAKEINILDLLVKIKFASSRAEAGRLMEQGGIKLDGEMVKDKKLNVNLSKTPILIQRGKRNYLKITI